MTLYGTFLNHSGKTIHKWTHYFPIYEKHFQRYVNRPLLVFEIGVQNGGSAEMWRKYFGPYAQIIGIDIDPICKQMESDQIEIRIGDQSDENFLASLIEEFGSPDVVIDDGSHVMSDLSRTFHYLYPLTRSDGVYFVEDLHTCYWPEFGGGLQKPESFIEIAKNLIDELNAIHTRGELLETQFSKETTGIHFYDSCIVFERGRNILKKPVLNHPNR
jgi:hypothetical protein